MKRIFAAGIATLVFGITATTAFADDRPPHPHHPPPEEAFTACKDKSAGDTCTVTFGDHTMNGTCLKPPPDVNETRLVCAPPHPPGPPPSN